jgi:hypothetical protein
VQNRLGREWVRELFLKGKDKYSADLLVEKKDIFSIKKS